MLSLKLLLANYWYEWLHVDINLETTEMEGWRLWNLRHSQKGGKQMLAWARTVCRSTWQVMSLSWSGGTSFSNKTFQKTLGFPSAEWGIFQYIQGPNFSTVSNYEYTKRGYFTSEGAALSLRTRAEVPGRAVVSPGILGSRGGGRTDLSFLAFWLFGFLVYLCCSANRGRVIPGLVFALSSPPFLHSPAAGGEVQPTLCRLWVFLIFHCLSVCCFGVASCLSST